MSNVLLVPMHLDALWPKTDLSVVEAKVDFSRLPYWDGKREINHDVANISEELLARPFQDRGLQLKAGVHLHWALPDALTKGVIGENGTSFPAVPNRWLVTRSKKGADGKERIECQWIVESDYLYPDDAGALSGGIAIPFSSGENRPPFRYLGRKMPFSAWKKAATGEYLGKLGYRLTAIGYEPDGPPKPLTAHGRGYGEPTFAAFYPNCQSVFGFHDAAPPAALRGVQYDVMGWYSDPTKDCLRAQEINAIKERLKTPKGDLTKEALKEGYQWDMTEDAAAKGDPDHTVFYGCLSIETDTHPPFVRNDKPVTIAVGNTGTQALSAYMAHTVAPIVRSKPPLLGEHSLLEIKPSLLKEQSLLEEQLEALRLASRLGIRKLDLGPKFEEARHERGFTAVPAGTLWGIRQVTASTQPADASGDTPQETLPYDLAHQLNALNLQQMALDQADHELESMQKQLFADWYKYMLCAYPPDDRRDDYPDIDEVRYFIEKNDLLPITRQQAKRKSLQSQCQGLHAQLELQVKEYRERTKKPYELQSRSAPRYWRPREPVILIVDDEIRPTTRHGHHGSLHSEGLLKCYAKSIDGLDIRKQPDAIREKICKLTRKLGDAPVGSYPWTKQPWHPFALEWSVEVMPTDKKNNLDTKQSRAYAQDFITSNYQLEEDSVDLVLKPGKAAVEKAVGIFTGSSILSPHAKFQLQTQIDAFLLKRLLPGYYVVKNPPMSDRTDKYFAGHRAEIAQWYTNLPEENKDRVVTAMLEVSLKLDDPSFHAVAQSLSGFNEALLMHKQTLQLPIAEPLGFQDEQDFTQAVRRAVGQSNCSAPQPQNDFHPIRTGVLRIRALRVIDTFGRVQNLTLKDDKVMATEIMTTPANPHLVFLPPRLVQPARLNFRWLAADAGGPLSGDEPEMNAHPATVDLGADLHLWGPEFSGEARIHWLFISFTVSFGKGVPTELKPIDWKAFKTAFLPEKNQICGIAVQQGLIRQVKDGVEERWIMNPKEFVLVTNSVIPSTEAMEVAKLKDGKPETWKSIPAEARSVAVRPVGVESMKSTHTITITKQGDKGVELVPFEYKPVLKAMPAALWGAPQFTDDAKKEFLRSPDLHDDNPLIEKTLCGFEIRPRNLPEPGPTAPFEPKPYETERIPDAFKWEDWTLSDKDLQGKNAREAATEDKGSDFLKKRDLLFKALGFANTGTGFLAKRQ